MKNITLSAPGELIEKARNNAAAKGTTLNDEFRIWLQSQTISADQQAENYKRLMQRLSYVDSGRKFTREEMNEH